MSENVIENLKRLAPRGYSVFKYYDSDEEPRESGTPDILDRLYERYDKIHEQVEKIDPRPYSENKRRDRLLNQYEEELDKLDSKVDFLNSDDGEYYFMNADFDILPVSKGSFKVQRIDVADGHLVFKDTDHTVEAYVVIGRDGVKRYVPATDNDEVIPDGQQIFYYGYTMPDLFLACTYYIGYETYKQPDDDFFCKCKDCGKIFILTDLQKRWYQNKGLQLPKRCYDCRQSRKDALETSAN